VSFEPSPKQALFLFGILFGPNPEWREPMKSKTRPRLQPKECRALIRRGLLEEEKRGRAHHLIATDAAWDWANRHLGARLSPGSTAASPILHHVLSQLGDFFAQRGLTLSDLFSPGAPAADEADAPATLASDAPPPRSEDEETRVRDQIRATLGRLGQGRARRRVRLADVRETLATIPRRRLDAALLAMQSDGELVLYRLDNRAELRPRDHEAALHVGDAPRHLVYLEGDS
jgi:hypothetical protein